MPDFTGGLAKAVEALPAEFQPVLTAMMDRIATLEAQGAKDIGAIADKVIAAILPEVQGMRVEFSAAVQETLVLIRRVNGLTVTVALGPEVQG